MRFEDRIEDPMKRLAHKLVDIVDEQIHWLTRLNGLLGLRALGGFEEMYEDDDLIECQSIVSAQLGAVRKMR